MSSPAPDDELWNRLAGYVNGKFANGHWSADGEDLVLTFTWGPGPKQATEIRIGSVLELHYATLAPAARCLEQRRAAQRQTWAANRRAGFIRPSEETAP